MVIAVQSDLMPTLPHRREEVGIQCRPFSQNEEGRRRAVAGEHVKDAESVPFARSIVERQCRDLMVGSHASDRSEKWVDRPRQRPQRPARGQAQRRLGHQLSISVRSFPLGDRKVFPASVSRATQHEPSGPIGRLTKRRSPRDRTSGLASRYSSWPREGSDADELVGNTTSGTLRRVSGRVYWEARDRPHQDIYVAVTADESRALAEDGDWLLIGALMPAQNHAEPRLRVDGPVSPVLLDHLRSAQGVLQSWYGETPIPIESPTLKANRSSLDRATALLFSGRIDSASSLFTWLAEVPSGHPDALRYCVNVDLAGEADPNAIRPAHRSVLEAVRPFSVGDRRGPTGRRNEHSATGGQRLRI